MSSWRSSREYRVWRAQVIMRDKRCVICNSINSRHAHHVNHATYFIDQRFDVDNGVTLCSGCHMNYHCNFHRSYRTKCDEYSFMNFVKLSTHFNNLWIEACVGCYDPNVNDYEHQMKNVLISFAASPDNVLEYVKTLKMLRDPG